MFSVQFDPTSTIPDDLGSNAPGGRSEFAKGYIDFGVKRKEWFYSNLHVWSIHDYEKHWIEALERVVGGQDRSALIVDLAALTLNDCVTWWPMWRFGDIVKFHEQLLFLSERDRPFDIRNPFLSVDEYGRVSDDGSLLSEWEVSVSDMAAFLEAWGPRIEIRG